jgi:branched-chain amino acid transport system substrate-binding protein
VPTYADAQSKIDVALNEAERLINDVKVDMVMGVYSSAQCVPLSAKVDAAKKFWWATVCIASGVLKDKDLKYVFRPTVHSDQYGEASCIFLSEVAKAKLGKDPEELRVAILHEDGPYGVGVAQAADTKCKELGIKVVHNEGYSATSTDLSALVTKLRRARPDVILHAGYNPDITLFLRQAKEAGLKFSGLIGHGAGYSQYGKLAETFGKDVDLFMDVDPVAAQILDAKALKPGLGDLIQEMLRRWQAQGGSGVAPPHLSMGFNNTYVFLTDVLPRAIKAHGGIDAEALRQAALETDIPIGGTIQGYGVKFYPPGQPMAGQNARAITAVMQYVDGQTNVVWPKELRTAEPILPLPPGHAYAP